MSIDTVRPRAAPEKPGQEAFPRLLPAIWALLVFNTLGSQGGQLLITLPRTVVQVVTMGAIVAAFGLALITNPRVRIRPSAFLFLLTLLLAASIAGSARLEAGYGSLFRCFRLTLFVATLWLISPWMDHAIRFVRLHLRALIVVLVPVAVGLFISPGNALPASNDGRLSGTLWPMTAPQVGAYSAVVAGLVVLLWVNRHTDGRSVAFIAGPAFAMLLLSHTRTALLGLVAGLLVAGLSLFLTSVRARKIFTLCAGAVALAAIPLGPLVQTWLLRGQDDEALSNLTGRTKVWDALLQEPRSWFEQVFGTGLSNKSFNGLPIDSGWLAVYHEQGYLGIVLVGLFLLTLVIVALSRPPSPARAYAIFLITYCLVASYTEVGVGDASPYLLHLFVAAALLSAPRAAPQRTVVE
ncbi:MULTISPECIES: hypothetical protein [Amycolatopsis]|uniref:O-antigen ligase domain-containing protein n=1 Tax=Amycolatopsis thermalba TaxID=944492 RepID=A0ABY4NNQ9_9PSEU|nr:MULTISPECIES: hypothetical protein [Amycolatopsis]OXM74137.1 hypothetical protein CF166_06720 [Amycolatopsis sp. KNN50.9b]UQS22274.1 O-antigen ligase domain-containing protein [Amycolatopsis thermalba]